jgi:DNA-binding XRE family transcriptional regulator
VIQRKLWAQGEAGMSPTRAEQIQHKAVAREWTRFRRRHGFTQVMLAAELGISRRTVQYTESGNARNPRWPCIPSRRTLIKFAELKARHERNGQTDPRNRRILIDLLGLTDQQIEQLRQILPHRMFNALEEKAHG